VAAGALRTRLISAAGVLSDAVICGQDAGYVAAMAWVNQTEARKLTGAVEDVALDDPGLHRHLSAALRTLNQDAGSASRVERLILLAQPPSLDAGEITDKGYLNQRRTLQCRAADVERLYADPPDPGVVTAAG
jgi:feruloyl-CoA synthase